MEELMLEAFADELEKIAEFQKEALTMKGVGNTLFTPVRWAGKQIGRGIEHAGGAVGKAAAGTSLGRAADKAAVFGKGQVSQAIKADKDVAKAVAKAEKRKAALRKMTPEQRLAATAPPPSAGSEGGSGPGGFLARNWKPIALGGTALAGGAYLANRMGNNQQE